MSSDFRLVVNSTKRYSHIFPSERVGNTLSEACLAHSRRTIEADDRGLEVTSETQHGYILEYALLHLFHAIVVVVEHTFCTLQVVVVVRVFAPWQRDESLQICKLGVEIRTLWMELVEFCKFFFEHIEYLVAHMFFRCLLHQLVMLW